MLDIFVTWLEYIGYLMSLKGQFEMMFVFEKT